jgi:hypothetical protein
MNDDGCGFFLFFVFIALLGGTIIIENGIQDSSAPQEDIDRIISATDVYPQLKPLVKEILKDDHFSRRELLKVEVELRKLKLED